MKWRRKKDKKNGKMKPDVPGTKTLSERKNKFSAISRLFKPWKWKWRRKSDKIQKTAIALERKISVRATREELIQKGVLKEDQMNAGCAKKETRIIEAVDENGSNESMGMDGDGRCSAETKPLENGVMLAEVVTDTSGESAVEGRNEHPTVTTLAEINASQNNSTFSTNAASPACVRPVVIPSPNSTSSPPPYNPVNAHIIVPTNNIIVDITNRVEPGTRFMGMGDAARVEDYDNVESKHPYETFTASEPDFSRVPRKSALKNRLECNLSNQKSPRSSRLTTSQNKSPSPTSSLPRASCPAVYGGVRVLPVTPSPQTTPRKPVPRPRTTVGFTENKENVPQLPIYHVVEKSTASNRVGEDQPDYDNVNDSDSSDSDDIQYRDDLNDPNSLAAKVARQDSLARFLNNRPSHYELVEKNIIPTRSEEENFDNRECIGHKLTRRLSLRPTHEELHQRNILRSQSNEERKKLMDEKRKFLVRKLSFRPSVEELRERKIIRFNDYVEVTSAHDYDRRADKPWTRLTPQDKATIRHELNEFKELEMDVHTDSKHLTRFHRP